MTLDELLAQIFSLPNTTISLAGNALNHWVAQISYGIHHEDEDFLCIRRGGTTIAEALSAAQGAFAIAYHFGLDQQSLERQAEAVGPAP